MGKKDNYFRKKNPYQEELEEDSDEDIKNTILERLDNIQFQNKNNLTEPKIENTVGKSDQIEGQPVEKQGATV